jgi:hypothetical protein
MRFDFLEQRLNPFCVWIQLRVVMRLLVGAMEAAACLYPCQRVVGTYVRSSLESNLFSRAFVAVQSKEKPRSKQKLSARLDVDFFNVVAGDEHVQTGEIRPRSSRS